MPHLRLHLLLRRRRPLLLRLALVLRLRQALLLGELRGPRGRVLQHELPLVLALLREQPQALRLGELREQRQEPPQLVQRRREQRRRGQRLDALRARRLRPEPRQVRRPGELRGQPRELLLALRLRVVLLHPRGLRQEHLREHLQDVQLRPEHRQVQHLALRLVRLLDERQLVLLRPRLLPQLPRFRRLG